MWREMCVPITSLNNFGIFVPGWYQIHYRDKQVEKLRGINGQLLWAA